MYKSNTSNNQGYDFVDYTGVNIEKIKVIDTYFELICQKSHINRFR